MFPKINEHDLAKFSLKTWDEDVVYFIHKSHELNKSNPFEYVLENMAKQTKLTVDRLTDNPETTWYHRISLENNNIRTEKIRFERKYSSLNIFLVKTEHGFDVDFNLKTTEGEIIPSSELNLFFGFLWKVNTYYILKIKDMNVLYLIRSLNITQHRNNLPAFIKYVLGPIEKTHKVEREDLVDVEIEEVAPKKQIQLTELAGSFLVMTPKFDYGLAVFDSEYQEFQEIFINNQYHKIKRHKEEEQNFRVYLKSLHPRFLNQFTGSHNLSFDDAKKNNWFFKVYQEWLEKDVEIIGMDLMKNFKYSPHPVSTKLTPKSSIGNLITFYCEVIFGKEKVKLSDIRKMLIIGGKSVYLKDNSLGILTDEWIDEYALLFKHGKISGNEITVPKWIGIAGENEQQSKFLKFNISDDWWKRWKNWQNSDKSVFNVPFKYQS